MERRIFGLENEYGVTCTFRGQRRLSPDEVARHGEFARMADVLIPFFVTRQIWCGAGKVLHGSRGAQYCISQRAEHIWEGVSSATTRSRPIINTRDEPHADAERFR